MMWSKAFATLFFILGFSFSATFGADSLYVKADLDTLRKKIDGVVSYRIPAASVSNSFEFQMYANIYSSAQTPYMKKGKRLSGGFEKSGGWGSTEIDSVLINNKNVTRNVKLDYTRGIFENPDHEPLDNKVVRIYFTTWIPKMGEKLSHIGEEYLLSGWFPVPAILKDNGEYYNPYYGAFAEYYGEYFYFDINLTLPENLILASPLAAQKVVKKNGLTNYHLLFGPAQDMALILSPYFKIDSLSLGETRVKIYYRPHEKAVLDRIRLALKHTFEYLERHVGAYVFPEYSIIIFNTAISGGMEFPGLSVVLSPGGGVLATRFYESLVIHETAHQWFFGMIGTDQSREPWLDESITTFFTQKIMTEYYGEKSNLFDFAGLKFSERDYLRTSLSMTSGNFAISSPAEAFVSAAEYFGTIYFRGSLAVETFDNLMPDSLSDIFWKEYYRQYLFKHPNSGDFIKLANEVAGEDIGGVLKYLLNNYEIIDYAVDRFEGEWIDSLSYELRLILKASGEINLPVEYRIILANKDTSDFIWDRKYNSEEIIQILKVPPIEIIIDPNNIYAIDYNLLNNSCLTEPDNRAGVRLSSGIMFLVESLLSYLGGI